MFSLKSIVLNLKDSDNNFPEEISKSIEVPGFPKYIIYCKAKTPIILLRNLNIAKGLCNGTRLFIEEVKPHVLVCSIMTGPSKVNITFVPKIKLHYEETEVYGLSFGKYQFPNALAFAITINKSQEKSFYYVGIYLNTQAFSHGQLYVALSRSRNKDNIFVGVIGKDLDAKRTNVVVRNLISQN
ncbi:hypothetical protein O181_078379 [Austropuccinia psidii MF-1]|uniref:DNA helicase Pif1-like 2B domain-containing protein n=1 Tax=Austropuccinia psidii MF-1 TaxID=1389203 RepID=A0A9Q3FGF4_9BASI|nr:hypothetical protein [Austropuccinia psidii MF-1]